jgi:endonuclease/exonuclease/phosphatase family metal-dependent hydrolase
MAELTLVTFNTHYGLRSLHDHATPYDLGAVLVDLAADAMVIQEVWRPDGIRGAVDDFAETHGYVMHHVVTGRATCRRRRWPHHHHDGEGTIGTAILTRVPAQRQPDVLVGPTLGDPAPRRAVVHVEVGAAGEAGPLQLVGVHLTSRLPHGPPLQLRRLAGALPGRGTAALVAGDCNFWGPPVVMLLADGWRRTVTGRTWPARRPHSQIDHVLVRPGDVRVLDAEVGADVGSDHRPLRVRVAWPNPAL